MTRFIDRESLIVLRPLPNSTAGDLALVLIRVATSEGLEGDRSRSRDLAVRQCSSRAQHPLLKQRQSHPEKLVLVWSSHGLHLVPRLPNPSHPDNRSVLDVRVRKGCRVPRHLAGPALALKRGSSVIEATKALAAHQPGDRRPVAIEPLPAVEVPAALHKAAAMATHTAGVKVLDTNSLWRIE